MYLQSTRLFMGFFFSIVAIVTSKCKSTSQEENCLLQQPVVEYYQNNNGMQYLFFSQRVTWEEAKILCQSYNAHMAILDTMEKAQTVAKSIATSNILMEDTWIGGRRIDFVWHWIEKKGKNSFISMESNVEDYPPWSRRPIRPSKECLAIDRRSHEHPNFLDLDCRLARPFICEKKKKQSQVITRPIPSKWIQINKNTFILYYGKLTWQEAITFCRAQGARLAILKNAIVVGILASSMTKTRPDFETIWVGAHFSYGQWVWISSGAVLNLMTDDETGYPPWRYGRSETNSGCLLLDRHMSYNATLIAMPCDRKRDFVCEEYDNDDDDDDADETWMDEPVKFSYENSTFIIYATPKTWLESRNFCSERASVFAHVDHMDAINLIVEAMGDHPRAISHVWLGGYLFSDDDEWRWIANEKKIPKYRDEFGYPPWTTAADIANAFDSADNASCLNLDRSDHVKAHFYALDCNSRQAFVCKIACDVPPPAVKNGTWNCSEKEEETLVDAGQQECLLQCDKGLVVVGGGVVKATCTFSSGWSTKLMDFPPLCLSLKNYGDRMFKSASLAMQKSFGYYLLLDHSSASMKTIALKMAALIIQSYPLSSNFKGGMTTFMTDPPAFLPLNQTDSCVMLSSIRFIEQNMNNTTVKPNVDRIYNDISMYNGRRISIFAIIDGGGERGSAYAKTLQRLKAAGHHILIIGLRKDWEILLPLATTTTTAAAAAGHDKRANLFLLDKDEFQIIITNKQGKKSLPCLMTSTDGVQTTTTTTTLRSIAVVNETNVYKRKLQVETTTTLESSIDEATADMEY